MTTRAHPYRWMSLLIPVALSPSVAFAQDNSDDDDDRSTIEILQEEVIVTATKKAGGVDVQDAPVSMTAFGEQQLDALQVRDIVGLGYKMPNVALDDIGTTKGVANFTIRGLGVNSSIPSIDPAVGVFVDGVYLGSNAGVIFDTFDLESVETLRGPQGVLFGRNVTGGAVLINTGDPTDEFTAKIKLAGDSGFRDTGANLYAQGVVSGPIIEGRLNGKLGLYYNDDAGWFENTVPTATGTTTEEFGESETTLFRGGLEFFATDALSFLAKYERGENDGQGPAAQSHTNGAGIDGQIVNFDRDDFDFSIDERGFTDAEWNQFSLETNLDVAFGNGVITNIFGYRDFSQRARSDIDASPGFLFHANVNFEQEQISNELRFNGNFMDDKLNFTAGLFYFEQDLTYGEQRDLLGGALTQDGGAIQDQRTVGVFLSGDYYVTDAFSINLGIRYTDETKEASIASLVRNVNAPCFVVDGDPRSTTRCAFDFNDDFETDNWSPKIGFGYQISDISRIYAHWARAFRAGGFNFRNTAIDTVNFGPGPFNDEEINSFEFGYKSEPYAGARFNAAFFVNVLSDLQREINLADPIAGVVQVIRNTADADIYGLELDATLPVTDNLLLTGAIGWVTGQYQDIIFDLNSDGVIDSRDTALDIPRLSPLTVNLGVIYAKDIRAIGETTFSLNYAYRDEAAYTDDNLGVLNEQNRIDASIAVDILDTGATLTLYGRNLTNEVNHGGDTQLPSVLGPAPLGGTFAPLTRGRQIGLELIKTF
ncbi:MAG: TonB-dependent receptor [Pseudomonadota bacterium]